MEFFARVGLHYGHAVIGNMGSDDRINYTAVGDTVNTASRLEGLGKSYEKDILASRSVVDAVIREGEWSSLSSRESMKSLFVASTSAQGFFA